MQDQQVDLFGEPLPRAPSTAADVDRAAIELFGQWWQWYPRKIAVGKAREAFIRAYKKGKFVKPDIPAMIDTLKWQTSEVWVGRGEQYIPHGATYINHERWKDERPTRIGAVFGAPEPETVF